MGGMRGSEFVFDSVDLLHYKFHKASLNGSCINPSDWLINKKVTINPNNNDDKYLLYVLTVALNYQDIKNNPERITKVTSLISQYS